MTVVLTVLPTSAPWAVLAPMDTPMVSVPYVWGRRSVGRVLSTLPLGAPVALVGPGLVNRSRLRRVATTAGIVIEHEYIVLPTVRTGRCVVEDDPDTMAVLWRNLAAPPPGVTHGTGLLTLLARLGRRRLPWWALGAVSPRVAIGRRR